MATKKVNSQKSQKRNNNIGYVNVNDDGSLTTISVGPGILAKCEPDIPTLDIEGLSLSENTFTSYGNSYDVPTLIQFAKEKGYKTFDMPLVGIYIGAEPFRISDFAGFLYHLKRVKNVDISNPILIDNHGYICDGWHRVAKAFLEGKKTIKAIRLLEMPEASGKVTTN